jgi:alkylated DNA repair dioxygenase AlkB
MPAAAAEAATAATTTAAATTATTTAPATADPDSDASDEQKHQEQQQQQQQQHPMTAIPTRLGDDTAVVEVARNMERLVGPNVPGEFVRLASDGSDDFARAGCGDCQLFHDFLDPDTARDMFFKLSPPATVAAAAAAADANGGAAAAASTAAGALAAAAAATAPASGCEIVYQQWYHMPGARKSQHKPLLPLKRIKVAMTVAEDAQGRWPLYRFPVNNQQRYGETRPMTPTVEKIRLQVEAALGNKWHFNHAVVLFYRGLDDCIGFHKDKTLDLTPGAPIVSVSLGCERVCVNQEHWERSHVVTPCCCRSPANVAQRVC